MGDFELWYRELPFVTRTYMTGALITAGVISFGIVNPMWLVFDFDNKL